MFSLLGDLGFPFSHCKSRCPSSKAGRAPAVTFRILSGERNVLFFSPAQSDLIKDLWIIRIPDKGRVELHLGDSMFIQHILIIPCHLLIVRVVVTYCLNSAIRTMQIIEHITHLAIGQYATRATTDHRQQDACYACYFCVKKFQSFRVSRFLFLWKNLIQTLI